MIENIDIALLEFLNGSASSFLDALMLTLTSGYTWIPLYVALLYLVINNSETMSHIILVVGCVLFVIHREEKCPNLSVTVLILSLLLMNTVPMR